MTDSSLEALRAVDILGVRVHAAPAQALVDYIADAGVCRKGVVVGYANAQAVNLAWELRPFRKFLNEADLVFCDGFGVRWAARFLHGAVLPRHTPPDWFSMLAKSCARRGLTIYFLGARPGVAEKAAAALQAQIPGLQIAGLHDGYFDKSPSSAEQQRLIEDINRIRPAVLVVGFGMPVQEQWIAENRSRLDVGAFLAVGAMFDYIAGTTPRAPRWMTDHGLEWLGRLLIEPGRLWKRYILGNPIFIFRVLLQKAGLLKAPD